MWIAAMQKKKIVRPDTLVYVGHEKIGEVKGVRVFHEKNQAHEYGRPWL